MIHDEAHEVKQDEAIRMLAQMVAGMAHRMGASDMVNTAQAIDAMLKADEDEAPTNAAAPSPIVEHDAV